METEVLEHTMNLVEKFQQATTKIKNQEEEITQLEINLLTAKQKSDQLMDEKENKLKVNILSIIITENIPIGKKQNINQILCNIVC